MGMVENPSPMIRKNHSGFDSHGLDQGFCAKNAVKKGQNRY
jgi:hypothetical protein